MLCTICFLHRYLLPSLTKAFQLVAEINAPGMQVLKIPLKRSPITGNAARGERGSVVTVAIFTLFEGQGVDEGPEAANWWTKYLDMPVRFVRFDSGKRYSLSLPSACRITDDYPFTPQR